MHPRRARILAGLLAALAPGLLPACAPTPVPEGGAAVPPAAPAAAEAGPWILRGGTTTLGFGILRLAPAAEGTPTAFTVRYVDYGDGGYSSDGTNACLFALPGDAFETSDAAYADRWLAFARVENVGGPQVLEIPVTVDRERTVLIAYGPWDGADVGRPPSDTRTYSLRVLSGDGGTYRWIESEAGEMVTTNWTARPGVKRGGPVTDPLTGRPLWVETRVLVLYDARVARAAGTPPGSPRDGELLALTPPLHEVLARVPIKWR